MIRKTRRTAPLAALALAAAAGLTACTSGDDAAIAQACADIEPNLTYITTHEVSTTAPSGAAEWATNYNQIISGIKGTPLEVQDATDMDAALSAVMDKC